jgi:uncharacterized protein
MNDTTPNSPPDSESQTELDDLAEPLTQAELEALDEILFTFAEQHEADNGTELESILSVSELDGFMTAIASGPEDIEAPEWFAAVFSGEPPDLEADEKVQHLFDLMLRHLYNIEAILDDDPEEFEPLFGYQEIDGVEIDMPDEWCMGYLRGVSLRGELWEPLWDDEPEALTAIALFGTAEGWDELEALDEETRAGFREMVPATVRMIYGYWQAQRNTPVTLRREAAKTGRNDPCPCGSGKKYKQCCAST